MYVAANIPERGLKARIKLKVPKRREGELLTKRKKENGQPKGLLTGFARRSKPDLF